MSVPYVSPGPNNTFVPAATTGLILSHSRNVDKFAFLDYVKYQQVDKRLGYYKMYRAENNARVSQDMGARFSFEPGMPRPTGFDQPESFRYNPYQTYRHSPAYGLDQESVDQADDDQLAKARADIAQLLMTLRGVQIATALVNADYAEFGTTATASSLGGGYLDAATAEAPYISKAISNSLNAIHLATTGAVEWDDFRLVMNPNTAIKLGHSQEMHAVFKQSVYTQAMTAREKKLFSKYGLPLEIAGIKPVVDDTVRITSKDGASTTVRGYTIPDNAMFVVSRPGGIDQGMGSVARSTVTMFWYKDEMTVEEYHDTINRRYVGNVTQDVDIQVTDARTAFKITNLFS